jgi:hypothetical protein
VAKKGSTRYAVNVMQGGVKGANVTVFDMFYSGMSKYEVWHPAVVLAASLRPAPII